MIKKIESFVENPYVNLLIGVLLFLSAISDAGDILYEDILHVNVRVHHGIMIYGIFMALQSIPNLFQSLERVFQTLSKKTDQCS
jgi:hypothetical protein